MRTEVLLKKADIVVALFGEQYRQWDIAADLATAIDLCKSTIDQAVEVLGYVFE